MSAFSEVALIKKLRALNTSQQSIQTLSLWLIHHRRNHGPIVKTWMKEFEKVSESKKLTFIYLANDVIQNSRKKGPEYASEFSKVLPNVFTNIGENHPSLLKTLKRILDIWNDRSVYNKEAIADYRARLLNNYKKKINAGTLDGDEVEEPAHVYKPKKSRSSSDVEKSSTSSTFNPSLLSPMELGGPPEPEELIKAMQSLENSASSDVEVRARIASLPSELSDMSCIAKIFDRDDGNALSQQVTEALELIKNYNARLAKEMEQRTRLAKMLRDYYAEQKTQLAQTEQRLEEHKKKHAHMLKLQKCVVDHINNLPDLTKLPDAIGGLAPLPSAGELFHIR